MNSEKLAEANRLDKQIIDHAITAETLDPDRSPGNKKINVIKLFAPPKDHEQGRQNSGYSKVVSFYPEDNKRPKQGLNNENQNYPIPQKTFDIIVQLLRGEFNEQHEALLKQWEAL